MTSEQALQKLNSNEELNTHELANALLALPPQSIGEPYRNERWSEALGSTEEHGDVQVGIHCW